MDGRGDGPQDTLFRRMKALVCHQGLGYQIVAWMRKREDRRARVRDLVPALNVSKSRVSRSLTELSRCGIVQHSPTGSYRLDSQGLPKL